MDPFSASIKGAREIGFAVITMTMTLVAVYAPLAFTPGRTGRLFIEFALALAGAVVVSGFVALTLTPMLCSRYLSSNTEHGKLYHSLDGFFAGLDNFYARLLNLSLIHRWKVVIVTILVVASSAFFFSAVTKEFVPEADEGKFNVSFKTPLGSSLEYTNTRLDLIEKVMIKHTDDIASFFSVVGAGAQVQVNAGRISVRLKDRHERANSQKELIATLKKELGDIPGVQAYPVPASMVRGQRSEKLQFNITGPSIENVSKYAKAIQQSLVGIDGFGKVDLDLQLD